MWTSLILSMLLLHCLVALPTPEPKDLDSWSADTASQEGDKLVMVKTTAEPWSAEATCSTVTKTNLFQNQDDPTCTTYLYCYVLNGSATALIRSCKTGSYFDATTRICRATKPDYCT
ncbi:uncharacterized protein [Drosophila suzukii]|uniref:Chitin-binding type-2 domain-containing protein n=1 Tax=Drosophila suzukii TaxID=28584 RepID=A0ABM4TQH1_DROSZ